MIDFDCPACRAELEADLELAGATITCPSCQHEVVVPPGAIARGSVIAGYRIERHLGGGNMGEVYIATQLSVERRVALKILPPSLAQHTVFTAALLREARALARIEHPGIVSVLDAGSDNACFYLASPLIEGEDLGSRLGRVGRLPERETVHVALEVARILEACWDTHGIAHLDLKPSNVMVDSEGHVRLLDLGLTGHLFGNADVAESVLHLLLSPYVSPEQLEKGRAIDFRADIYALGAMMFHLATGRQPFHETVADELVTRILNQPVPSARDANPELSEDFDQLIADLTVKDAKLRPSGWDLVVERLEAMESSRAAPAPRRQASAARHTVSKAAPHAGARVIKVKAGETHLHVPTPPREPPTWPWVLGVFLLLAGGGAYYALQGIQHRKHFEEEMKAEVRDAKASEEREARKRAEDLVKAARAYLDAHPKDLSGCKTQVWTARQSLQETPYAAEFAPQLDALDAELAGREQVAAPAPAVAEQPAPAEDAATPAEKVADDRGGDEPAPDAAAKPASTSPAARLQQAAARLLERDYAGVTGLLPEKDDPVDGVDVGALRKELAELPRWTEHVCAGLRESVGQEVNLAFRDGAKTLMIRSVSAQQVRAEKVVREGDKVIGRSSTSFRLEDLSSDELIRQLHGERGGTSALMSGLACYRAGRLSDARAWFNRTTSPWAGLLVKAMDEADVREMR